MNKTHFLEQALIASILLCSILPLSAGNIDKSANTTAASSASQALEKSDARKSTKIPSRLTLSRAQLLNKIKGGWAGQTIGVTYGWPTEFRYLGQVIDQNTQIEWGDPDYILKAMKEAPGLYDDIYMDLTFVEVFERLGIDAPTDSLAAAFAYADYPLWHANQAARHNILNGIKPPLSGHWINSPHADDIDYQIEADYAGLMSPAMPNAASEISDRIGHIMNYGDGWYGGVYMGAMYSLAFVSDDVEFIVTEALKCIPHKSRFYRCMDDVIQTYRAFPDDWHKAWDRCRDHWNDDAACPDGALLPLNIDAVINSAYVIIGLLYGGGDFGRTIDIATRCGQDSDCNPASAGGILGTALGYDNIPARWLDPLKRSEDIDFAYTDISLNDTYRMSLSHALQIIERNGGTVSDDAVTIRCQRPKAVPFEQCFDGLRPQTRIKIGTDIAERQSFQADCEGIVFRGWVSCPDVSYVAEIEVTVDGNTTETIRMPVDANSRRLEPYWNFTLAKGSHSFDFRWLNPRQGANLHIDDALILSR